MAQTNNAQETGQGDAQALAGLLENLVPLLLRFQSQSFNQSWAASQLPLGAANGALNHQAALTLTEDIIADALKNLAAYAEESRSRYQGLDQALSGYVARARQAVAARDHSQAFALIFEAYRAVALARTVKTDLPPIRRASEGERTNAFH